MEITDELSKSDKIQERMRIVAEPESGSGDELHSGRLKYFMGNDRYSREKLEHKFEPLYKHTYIWPENEPSELKLADKFLNSMHKNKSRKTYEIKSIFVANSELDEYSRAKKLFDEPEAILNISSAKRPLVFDPESDSFYLMNLDLDPESIFKFAYDDIAFIHYTVHGITRTYKTIKSITLTPKGMKYNFGEDFIDGIKLNIRLFEVFIECGLDVENTIEKLKYSN